MSEDSPGGPVVKDLPVNAGDTGWIPGPGRFQVLQSNWPVSHNYWSPLVLEPILCKKVQGNEKPVHCD